MENNVFRRKNRDKLIETEMLKPPHLGQYWEGQGGVYAGIMYGEYNLPDYHIIVPDYRGEIGDLTWSNDMDSYLVGPDGVNYSKKASSIFDGLANTIALRSHYIDHPAALWTATVEIDGHTDFYLPAKNELALCSLIVPNMFKKDCWYYTSTQDEKYKSYVYIQEFSHGNRSNTHKLNKNMVHAVRRILIDK